MTASTGGIIRDVAFSSDGTLIVSGSHDCSVQVWDASTGVESMELMGHTASVISVKSSSDSTQIHQENLKLLKFPLFSLMLLNVCCKEISRRYF